MADDRIPMTREGYEKKKAELDRLQHVEMLEVTKRVASARDLGDLSENAEYHAAREDQGILQAKVNMLKDQLARAYIVEADQLPTDTIVFGSRVKVKDLDLSEEWEFTMVGSFEAEPEEDRISNESPIGSALQGAKVGDTIEAKIPAGQVRYKVLSIRAS